MIRKLIGTIVIGAVLVGGVIWAINWRAANTINFTDLAEQVSGMTSNAGRVISETVANEVGQPGVVDHVRGNPNARVILVEYADMQCPGCAALAPVMRELYEDFGDEIGIVFRHFVLSTMPNSRAAAIAVEAAGQQDRFWEMLEMVFANQATWGGLGSAHRAEEFRRLAELAGVPDIDRWHDDYRNSMQFDVRIRFGQALGRLQGVDETPTIFLNGERLPREVAGNPERLREAIESALAD
ncbi:DsbA family protein [Candidatus Saccharibacteria bacterium]|nr:DsbA family protein [Candidatus Saccharibacteria bacterium]